MSNAKTVAKRLANKWSGDVTGFTAPSDKMIHDMVQEACLEAYNEGREAGIASMTKRRANAKYARYQESPDGETWVTIVEVKEQK